MISKQCFIGVVKIKKLSMFLLISIVLITISTVSAEDVNGTVNIEDSIEPVTNDTISNSEIITKKVSDNITKTTGETKSATKVLLNAHQTVYNSSVTFTAKIINSTNQKEVATGKAVFKLNGNTIAKVSVSNGIASYTFKTNDMSPKIYNLTFIYGENSYYKGSSANSTFTIVPRSSKIIINNATVVTKANVTFTAKITDKNTGALVNGGKVVFKINGKTVGYANVTNGYAYFKYTASSLSAKNYTLIAKYGGNKFFNSSTSLTSILKVTTIPTTISISKVSAYSTSVVLTATVKEKSSSKLLSSGSVLFKINDKSLGYASISNGKALYTYNTSQLTGGTYKISAILKANSIYASNRADNNLTILTENSFTYTQIKNTAVDLRTQYESNNLITSVYISKSRIGLQDFLALMIKSCNNIKKGNTSAIPYKHYKSINTQQDSIKAGVYDISEVLDIGNRALNFLEENNRPPTYVKTSLGNLGYYNLIYTYTRVMDVTTSNYLPKTCKVYNWAVLHPSNPKTRTIYITSDNILNTAKDTAFMNSIKTKLESLGYNAIINGLGPNTHNTAIRSESLPINAVQVSIFGGADPGVIYDVSTRSFMRLKANRMIFFVYNPVTSKDITGLSFLKRAKDDNYSPSSFTGIANPDIYLKNHGYDYVYSNNIDTIVSSLIKYIS